MEITMEGTQKINRAVEHPAHYNQYPIETIDMIERIFGLEDAEKWCIITAFKYRMRMGHKDDIMQDMEKEQWYLRRAEEIRDRRKNIQYAKVRGEIAPLTEEQEKVAKDVSRKMTDAIMKQLQKEK